MNIANLLNVEPVLADRTRMVIMTIVSASKEPVSFMSLLDNLGLTKGNLASHLKKLETEGYVKVVKEFVNKKPLTTYEVTSKGLESVKRYLAELEVFISKVEL